MFFASKSVQLSGRAHSLGRLFAGSLSVGQELYVYDDGVDEPRRAKVLSLVRQQTRGVVRIEHAVAGDVVGVCGLSLNLGKRSSFVFLLLTMLLIVCQYI
jgi:translation elongation factor EF-G